MGKGTSHHHPHNGKRLKKTAARQTQRQNKYLLNIMIYKIYSEETLESLSLPRIKEIAAELGTKPVVDARFKKTWILAILRKQATLSVVIEPVEIIVADDDQTTVDDNPDAPDILTIDDSLVCKGLGLEFRNPWAQQCTGREHIEPSGSIVAEVCQDGRFIGCVRRYYTAAGLFYTPDRLWDGSEYRTHYAAALSLMDSGEVEIARVTVERDLDDQYIAKYLTPPPDMAVLPHSKQFSITDYCPRDQTDGFSLKQILENGGRWFSVHTNGHDDYINVEAKTSRKIGEIKMSSSGYCEYYLGTGMPYGRNYYASSLDNAAEGIKQLFIAQQSSRAAASWRKYLSVRELATA